MAKQAGMGDRLFVAGVDLSGDIGSLGRIGGGPAAMDVTAIDKEAMERLGGLRDGAVEFNSYFNPSLGQAHKTLGALPTADVLVSYFRGIALGGPSANLVAKQVNYDGTRNADGSLSFAVQAQANAFGLEWGTNLTAGKRSDGSASSGTAVDFGASTLFGLQAYLHVFAFTGTSVTVKIQESSDNGGADPWADVVGGAFTAATGVTSQRIATAPNLTVERYLRVTTSGTFSSALFAVSVVKNESAVVF